MCTERSLDDRVPELAKSFLCSAFILSELGAEAAAAHQAIRAAWVCDDEGASAKAAAVRCRLRAVELAHDSEAKATHSTRT
jgi:hypothetical protein